MLRSVVQCLTACQLACLSCRGNYFFGCVGNCCVGCAVWQNSCNNLPRWGLCLACMGLFGAYVPWALEESLKHIKNGGTAFLLLEAHVYHIMKFWYPTGFRLFTLPVASCVQLQAITNNM